MKNPKLAQNTKLDEILDPLGKETDTKQLSLQQTINEPGNSWSKPYTRKEPWPQEEYSYENAIAREREQKKKEQLSRQQRLTDRGLNQFVPPALSPEQIKYRNLNEKETQELLDEEKTELASKWYSNKYPPSTQQYFDLNKQLPEEAKKQILERYNQFRAHAIKFQQDYIEANQFAATDISFNYDQSYINLFKSLPNFILRSITYGIGSLFGNVNKTNAPYGLKTFFQKGFNLFNITPLNFQDKLSEMEQVEYWILDISKEYDRRKKLLKRLPKEIDTAMQSFVRKKDFREFMNWLDQYFPNNKKEFFEGTINEILSVRHSTSSFNLGSLAKIKTYSGIYYSINKTIKLDTQFRLEKQVKDELRKSLLSLIQEKASPIFDELKLIIQSTTRDNLNELERFAFSKCKFDLRGIFQFVRIGLQNWDRNKDKDRSQSNMDEDLLTYKDNFIEDLKKQFRSMLWTSNLNNIIDKFIENHTDLKTGQLKIKELSAASGEEINNLMYKCFRQYFIDALPNFVDDIWAQKYTYPNFSGARDLINETGKLSPDNTLKFALQQAPIVPKEFFINLIKTAFKGQSEIFKGIADLSGAWNQLALKILLDLLKKSNKYNPDSFTRLFIEHFSDFNHMVSILKYDYKLSSTFTDDETIKTFSNFLRNSGTVERDKEGFESFINFIHNSAGQLPKKDFFALLENKNYRSYNKVGIAKKLLNSVMMLKSLGGLVGIYKKYGEVLKHMQEGEFIGKDLQKNIRFVLSFFNSNQEITPAHPLFNKLFEITSKIETDLQVIEMSEALKELTHNYQKKDSRLFDLDLTIRPDLRFRVLKDKDPRMLRVGIETNCCQRIGGVGEDAAKDSFVNPLAGVLILEWNNQGEWKLLTQSYFHYVPKDNSYILDNVEHNIRNEGMSDVNVEAAYAYLGSKIKEKLDVKYFVAGKSYSKLDVDKFKTHKLNGRDPRFFDPKAGGKYSDYSPDNSINLLEPKFKDDMKRELSILLNPIPNQKEALLQKLEQFIKLATT